MTVTSRKDNARKKEKKEKWQAGEDKPSSTNKVTPKEQLLEDWDNVMVMTGVKLPEGADVDDLLDELVSLKQFGFDENEHEALKMMRDGKRLAAPRQLGDWITIEIDATKTVRCNCELILQVRLGIRSGSFAV